MPEYLLRCLQTIANQHVLPDEIIIADDGSDERTKQVIEQFKTTTAIPVIHVWPPDEGFRVAAIRNKAIAAASGEYIINIDGDILLDKNFVHDHLYFARFGWFIAGERAFLTLAATQKYLDERNGFPSFYTSSINKRQHAFRCRLLAQLHAAIRHTATPYMYVVGCNMSFRKDDLLKINGYNEAFKGWGGEDFDIAARLFNAGVKQYFLRFYAVAYHLYHPESDRSNSAANDLLFRRTLAENTTRIEQGIDKHLHKV